MTTLQLAKDAVRAIDEELKFRLDGYRKMSIYVAAINNAADACIAHVRSLPEPGELPEVPEALREVYVAGNHDAAMMEALEPVYSEDQLRAYGEQCRAATVVSGDDCWRRAWNHLCANSYDHHTPHMICIPTDKWKDAENMLPQPPATQGDTP